MIMIRRLLVACWLALAVVCHAVAAESAINPSPHLLGRAQFCYAGLFPVYEANYYRLPGSGEGQAEGRCLQLSYKRAISASVLAEATWKTFEEQHGAAVTRKYQDDLQRFSESYRDVDAEQGYMFCLTDGHQGVLYHDSAEILKIEDQDLARRYMQIWVNGESSGVPQWTFRDCS